MIGRQSKAQRLSRDVREALAPYGWKLLPDSIWEAHQEGRTMESGQRAFRVALAGRSRTQALAVRLREGRPESV